uniref:eIF-4F 25 kDa subunit n=1 Tax=Ascaris suum TaxID=6253 RepID=F1LDA2_ASCSU
MLHNTCDYNVFKENIQPMWEVPENANGGRWLITIDKSRHHDLLDAVWLEVLLAVIGDQFGKYTDDICGIVVNIRNKGSKISIWTTNASNDESNLKIGYYLSSPLLFLREVTCLCGKGLQGLFFFSPVETLQLIGCFYEGKLCGYNEG